MVSWVAQGTPTTKAARRFRCPVGRGRLGRGRLGRGRLGRGRLGRGRLGRSRLGMGGPRYGAYRSAVE